MKHYPELRYEPYSALVAPKKGLALIEKLIQASPDHLNPGSVIILEIGSGQARDIRRMVKEYLKTSRVTFVRDLAKRVRVAVIE